MTENDFVFGNGENKTAKKKKKKTNIGNKKKEKKKGILVRSSPHQDPVKPSSLLLLSNKVSGSLIKLFYFYTSFQKDTYTVAILFQKHLLCCFCSYVLFN